MERCFKKSEILNQYYYGLKYNKDELNNGKFKFNIHLLKESKILLNFMAKTFEECNGNLKKKGNFTNIGNQFSYNSQEKQLEFELNLNSNDINSNNLILYNGTITFSLDDNIVIDNINNINKNIP